MKRSLATLMMLAMGLLSAKVFAVSCAGVPQWNSGTVYNVALTKVQQDSELYENKWWTQGESPATNSSQWAVWRLLGTCDGVVSSSSVSSVRPSSSSSSRSSVTQTSSSRSSAPSSSSRSSVPSSSAPSSIGSNCTSPQFSQGTSYAAGQLVQNAGSEYRCVIAGWCTVGGWAYTPGTGTYWDDAWDLVRSCGVASSSVTSSSRSSVASNSSSRSSSSVGAGRYRIISGYWHNFDNGSGVIPIDQISDAYDAINVSFAEPINALAKDGRMAFVLDSAFDKTSFKAGIKAKQAAGKKIIISIGGANGQVVLPDVAARNNFVNTMKAIIDEYGFDGLDIDFEGHSLFLKEGDNDFRAPTTDVVVNLIGALNDLTNHYGDRFMLTMAPETFFVQVGYYSYGGTCSGSCDRRAGAYLPVIYAMRDKLDWLQVQNYNSGPIMGLDNQYHFMGGADFHVAMVDMLLTGFKIAGTNLTFPALRQDQVLIGLPANVNAGGGFTSVADVHTAMNCLIKLQGCTTYQPHTTTGWRDLRGVMTWSINWDKFNNFEFSTNHRAYLDKL